MSETGNSTEADVQAQVYEINESDLIRFRCLGDEIEEVSAVIWAKHSSVIKKICELTDSQKPEDAFDFQWSLHTLKKVDEWCHSREPLEDELDLYTENSKCTANDTVRGASFTLDKHDKSFFKSVENQYELLEIMDCANFFGMDDLLDKTAQWIAKIFQRYSIEELREKFLIMNDYSTEEENKLRQENAWAEEWEGWSDRCMFLDD